MKNERPRDFSQMTFMSTQANKNKRAELIPVKKGFFRYKSDTEKESKSTNPDHDSFSHELAIAVLSEMRTINFESNSKAYEINFDCLKRDDLKIRFEDGAVYYPDLMGFFSEPADLARKWGGKVAIEVKVTHACEPIKIKDFFDHNIPIIEILLRPSMRLPAEMNKVDFDEGQMERYYRYLQDKFSSVVYMKILSDPTMPNEFEKILKEKNAVSFSLKDEALRLQNKISTLFRLNESKASSIETLEKEKSSLMQVAVKLKESLDTGKSKNETLTGALASEQNTIVQLQEKIAHLEKADYHSMGFFKKLIKLFG